MEDPRLNHDYSHVVATLMNMFPNVMTEDAVYAIVESCGGDLNWAAYTIMHITVENDLNKSYNTPYENHVTVMETQEANEAAAKNIQELQVADVNTVHETKVMQEADIGDNNDWQVVQSPLSYVNAFHNTGAIPKASYRDKNKETLDYETHTFRSIVDHHNKGTRIAVLMRGAPGSGKSYLAKKLIDRTIGNSLIAYKTHICSTDDYFMRGAFYTYERHKLSEAHEWNQRRVKEAMFQGISPIVVDNTNIEIWEMWPYAREGVRNGYIIEVLQPNTPWAKKASQLARRNHHNVPMGKIKKMLENYEFDITGAYLLEKAALTYPLDLIPPVLRNIPLPINMNETPNIEIKPTLPSLLPSTSNVLNESHELTNLNTKTVICSGVKGKTLHNSKYLHISQEDQKKRISEIEKHFEEIQKVEEDWDRGEKWETGNENTTTVDYKNKAEVPKPPRGSNFSKNQNPKEIMDSVNKCKDWSQMAMFLPAWRDESAHQEKQSPEKESVLKVHSSTCIEIGDTNSDSHEIYKVLLATPRDINIFYLPLHNEKIPDTRMLDKSSMTNDSELVTPTHKCKNQEKHFKAFRNLFKNIPSPVLRDIFDKCCGDVNWAVDITLDGLANNQQFETIAIEELSDAASDIQETCECLSAYDIIPDATSQNHIPNVLETCGTVKNSESESINRSNIKKKKKEKISTETELKRLIEDTVVISDNHYSSHCLNIRKIRDGEVEPGCNSLNLDSNQDIDIDRPDNVQGSSRNVLPSTSIETLPSQSIELPESSTNVNDNDDEESIEENEFFVNINIGTEFVTKLDELFGRKGMVYPEKIESKVSLPMSLLNEINALWIESFTDQLDHQSKQNDLMIKQDEEFARQLSNKEAELAKEGKEPEVPDFKEIMDMDLALTVYQKDVAGWRNNEPNDLAAKLTRDKLNNLFPEVPPDTLSELLMAYENSFQTTVEVMLMSTGRAHILEEENGFNKFILNKEMEQREKVLKEQLLELNEKEWPMLTNGEGVQMCTVESYRLEADQYLLRRNKNYQKAQEYMRRGMTQVANYYSELANFHRQKYENASSMAAISLVQVHASNRNDNTTIDLHYLRVGEARESLDLFLDTHIQRLRLNSQRGGSRLITLFIITGRGLHSQGGPRVKPATIRRLKERAISHNKKNPGLLSIVLSADNKLTTELPQPK